LLSVLEQGHFVRRGGHDAVRFQGRIVATIDAGYERAIEAGTLRRELVSNLNILMARIPPLRDYAEDVPELLKYYVDKLVDSEGLPFRDFGIAAQNRLRNYPWPDNVRELKNMVRRLMLTGSDEEIRLDEVEAEIGTVVATAEPLVKQDLLALPLREAREQFERAYLQQQLQLCDGKVGKLAKRVGMERTHLYRKLRSLGDLIEHEGATVSRKTILQDVWGLHEDTDTRAIDNFVVRLRRYLEKEPSRPRHLLTVRGVGYRFIGESEA
jgi:DNA-binding NtrC family response regulator